MLMNDLRAISSSARDLDAPALAALLAVLDTGSFTLAARALRVSQPAVSLAIRRLEVRLGTALVVRTRGRVTASRPGELLAAGARRSFEALGQAVAQIGDERVVPAGRVTLGCHESLAAYALPGFMARFLRAYPKVELTLRNGRSAELARELVAGRLELALIVNPPPHPDCVVTPMFDDTVALFHALPTKRGTRAVDVVAAHPLVYVPELAQSQDVLTQLAQRDVRPSRLLPCGSLELVKSLVLDGVGVGVLPRRVAEHGTRKRLRTLSPPLPAYRDHVGMVRRYDVPTTAALRAVIDELAAHGRALR